MLAGTTIGRRFTLLHPVLHDVPGIERWVAEDTRLAQRVNLDIVTSAAAERARRVAASTAKVRDARLPRVLSSGVHRDDEGTATYIVTERPRGTTSASLLSKGPLAPAAAATLVGEAARALEVAAAERVHHGYVRPEALTVTPGGRVLVTGLGIDGVVAAEAGLNAGEREKDDAAALARIYAQAVTGADAALLTADHVPEGLGSAGTSLVMAVIADDAPATLAEISRTMGPPNARALRAASSQPRPTPASIPSVPSPESPASPAEPATPPTPVTPSAPSASAPSPSAPSPAETEPEVPAEPATASAAPTTGATETITPHVKDAPLEMLDEIVADQHARRSGGLWQILLERLHRWWPQSQPLTDALERARERANRPAPFNAGPLILGLAVVAVVVVAIVAFSTLTTITRPEGFVPSSPSPAYPEFTFSPSPSPSGDNEG